MRKHLMRLVITGLAAMLLLGGVSSASTSANGFGKPPAVCTDPAFSMPTCLLHTWVGNIQFSPHEVAVGGILTATIMNIPGIGTSSMQMVDVPPGELVHGPKSYCNGSAQYKVVFKQSSTFTCAWKMVKASGTWAWGSVNICGDYGCVIFEDYYGVGAKTSKSVIQGDVERAATPADHASTPLVPAASVKVSIGSLSAVTDSKGHYSKEITDDGTYRVSTAGYCVKGQSGCASSKDVKVPSGGTVDFTQPTEPELSGKAETVTCGESSCGTKPLPGLTVLVTGKKASDGSAVSFKDVTDTAGKWSVKVPKGSYTAGPTLNGKTFVGPSFDPEKRTDLNVGASGVSDVDFRVCGGDPGKARKTASASRQAAAAPHAPSFCASRYTVSVSAKLLGSPFVDPSTVARYNLSPDPKVGEVNNSTGWVHNSSVRWVLRLAREYPECFDEEKVKELSAEGVKVEWFSYLDGNASLGRIDVPITWDPAVEPQQALVETPKVVRAKLTREFKWRYTINGKPEAGTCPVTNTVWAVYLPVAGGNNAPGALGLAANEFTIIAAWPFPFNPPGVKIAENGSALGQAFDAAAAKVGGAAKTAFEHYEALPEPAKFFIDFWTVHFALGPVVKLVGVAANAAEVAAGANRFLSAMPTIAEGLHVIHDGYEWVSFLTGSYADLSPSFGGYPMMSVVIRGVFDTPVLGTLHPSGVKILGNTTLAVSAKSTEFPNIKLEVTRDALPATDHRKIGNGALPWATNTAGTPVRTWNSFANKGHKDNFISDTASNLNPAPNGKKGTPKNYASGSEAVQNVIADTAQLPAVARSMKKHFSLWAEFAGEEDETLAPACDKDGAATNTQTICWVFQDGRP